ncbi:MAG: alpha/beta hydrolase [Micrococcales bacterium]
MAKSHKFVVSAVAAFLTVILTGCAGFLGLPAAPAETPAIAATAKPLPLIDANLPATLVKYYKQKPTWKPCPNNKAAKCGTVTVPTNWAKPNGSSLKLAVAWRPADKAKPLGSILFNPGGPGSPAYEWVAEPGGGVGTANLRSNYNIVAFDPRGVGRSQPTVKCLDAKGNDELFYGDQTYPIGSKEDLAESRAKTKDFIDACVKNTGPAIQFVDTVSAAKDMDVLRAIFGDSRLNYLGYSYGTYLGTIYAAQFPKRVGHLVLDGAIDPTVSDYDQSFYQLKGFDSALKAYLADCLANKGCPFTGTVAQAETKIASWLRGLETNPLPAGGTRKLTVWAAETGLIMSLYSNSYWKYATDAFTEAFNQNTGRSFMQLADFYYDRNPDGTYATNLMEANIAIACMDARSDWNPTEVAKQNARVVGASTVFGRYWQNGALTCSMWPYPLAAKPKDLTAKGSAKILVIGTTNDPATPYAQAQALAKLLSGGVLVTYNGEGHTAYGRSNSCIDKTVDRYFINNLVPVTDPQC